MNYTSQAVGRLTNLMLPHLRFNGCLPEADPDINDASRQIVMAMVKDHGECWLGKINLYGDDRGKPEKVLRKYDGGIVYNFGASFVIPEFDQKLVDLIIGRDTAMYEGTKKDALRLDPIFNRIEKLGGHSLHWT